MSHDSFRYLFRFCCDPGFNDAEEIPSLLRYVDEALIDDVAVFANVEELNTGHMSYEEQDAYLAMMRTLQALLAPKGVSLSVNQWHSVMHADLGKALRPDQDFRLMVDAAGNEATLCVCPLCEAWQRYIAGLYARYAALEPSILWVEDDFRLHNHDPLTWGGCFCEEHMRLYSERAGKPLTREEFLRGVLQPGTPHPYRKIWLDVSRETLLSAARAIGEAVRGVSRQAKVGLMSSVPQVHAAEGRDWHALLYALAGGRSPVDRVHLPGYQESAPSQYLHGFNMVSMLTAAMLPPDCEIYPELESFPFSLFSKSRAFTRFQLLSALPLNLRGMTIDLYDLNGNGIVWEDGYQDMLRQTKPYLNAVMQTGAFQGAREGVRVLYNPRSAYTLHTRRGKAMEELYPQEAFFAGLLPALGVPYAYTDQIDMRGEIVAVSGQALRNWNKDELESLFRHNTVLLNADAAYTLWDMGLGSLAGIRSARWLSQNSGDVAYEQVVNGRAYCGRNNARASAMILCCDLLDVAYAEDASVCEYTALFDSFRRRVAYGQVAVNGRALIYPFGGFENPASVPPMLFNSVRQAVLQEMLALAGAAFPMVRSAPYLEPYCFTLDGERYLYLVNGATDGVEAIRLALPGAPPAAGAEAWPSAGPAAPLAVAWAEEPGGMRAEMGVPAMETVLLRLPVR